MPEYIEKEALLKRFKRNSITDAVTFADGKTINETIAEFPAAEVVEVRHGLWIECKDGWGDTYYDCSVCKESICTVEGTPADNLWFYCPVCGAKMADKAVSDDE